MEAGPGCVDFSFFFSSRRRHTRCSRDWSSDVCSSDLKSLGVVLLEHIRPAVLVVIEQHDAQRLRARVENSARRRDVFEGAVAAIAEQPRSEERRVGKECRFESYTYDYMN